MTDEILNEPAFPRPYSEDTYLEDVDYMAQEGMYMRDYFATRAMQVYLQDKDLIDMYVLMEKNVKHEIAKQAYQMADEMLKVRGQA